MQIRHKLATSQQDLQKNSFILFILNFIKTKQLLLLNGVLIHNLLNNLLAS